jgi:small-conductance mechanosensitive channel/predicted  nucleic acid-binding Zn-ribbon protein
MNRAVVLVLLYCALATGVAEGQEGAPKSAQQKSENQPAPAGKQAAPATPQETLSDAEQITRLQRTLDENEKLLSERKEKFAKLDESESEYKKAQTEFNELDKQLEARKKELQKLKDEGQADQPTTLPAEVDSLQQRWKLARERFDLAIQERKTLQEQITTLEQRIAQDRETLNKLLGPPATQPTVQPAQPPTTTTPAQPTAPNGAPPASGQPTGQPAVQPGAAVPEQPLPGPAPAGATPGAAPGPAGPTQPVATPPAGEGAKPPSAQVQKAQADAQAKAEEAEKAEERVRDIKARMETLRREIELAKEELATLRKKADNADETRRTLADLVQKRSAEGAPREELNDLWKQIGEARQRSRAAQAEVNQKVDRIDQLQDDLQSLQNQHITALEDAEQKRKEADKAKSSLENLQNPYSVRNLAQWLLVHGPRIVGILLGMFVLLWLVPIGDRRIVRILVGPATGPEAAERENRAKTLVGVFHNAAKLLIIVGGIFMILDEVGVPIAPLLGGAAVIGLAVAFGAQNLVRDYFSGFMILLENQYDVNDVIKVGDIGGLVERITLRVTVLRGLDGTVHFIPNGQIDKVSNMTHGWSRALFEIGVAYKEDVDQVMNVLVHLGKELRADPTFRQLILDDPEMLGVDSFDDSAVVIKFFIKTRPLQQWTVKRALLRRIKKKFDELGIEIPFPHRTVFLRYEQDEPPGAHPPITSSPSD